MGITAEPMSTPMARYTNPRLSPMLSSMTARPPIPIPKPTMVYRETLSSCLPVASGFRYVRYTSYVISDDTAMSSADPAEVTAINSMVSTSTAPTSPMRTDAAAGTVRPSCTCSGVRSTSKATAVRPMVVASVKGIANQQAPPRRKPFTVDWGWAAMARCQ